MAKKKAEAVNEAVKTVSLKTTQLQEMVARAVKGAGNNKLIPITGFMCVKLERNKLTLITTDGSNYLYIEEDKVAGNDFYVVVDVDMFSKLVSRLTCENVTLTLDTKAQVLLVKGNGDYRLELQVDENAELIQYPNPIAELTEADRADEINLSTIKVILNSVKPALATTLEIPCYTGYYAGERIVATDTFKIAAMDVQLFKEPVLISPETMNLLSVMTAEKIKANFFEHGIIVFSTPDCVVYSREMEGINDFDINAINGLIDSELESFVGLAKNQILQLLERLSLFVSTYDKNVISLVFTKDGLQVSSKASSGIELIPYTASDNFKNFSCLIDIEMLTQQVKAISSDLIELHYGEDNAIKITDGNITLVIALSVEE